MGSHVAEQLAVAGHEVTVFSRSFNDRLLEGAASWGVGVTLALGAVPPGDGVMELIDGADVVFYLAGASTPAAAATDPGGSITGSVLPAATVLDMMRATSTRRIVVASSGGTVYGMASQWPTSEKAPTRPISIHGHNALTIERYALFFAEAHGFETVILRYANPYGPGQVARRGQGVIAAWLDALIVGREIIVYGDLSTRRDFVFVADAARATAAAGFAAPAPAVYNVGSGGSESLEIVLGLIEEVSGCKPSIRRLPARGVDVQRTELDCSLLTARTGWRPSTSFLDGLSTTWQWIVARVAQPRRN